VTDNPERQRLRTQRQVREDWHLWGPYLAERAGGTVREDDTADGDGWVHFDHNQARSRAYRWNEHGLAGLCDSPPIGTEETGCAPGDQCRLPLPGLR
jgi:hypothetical protein